MPLNGLNCLTIIIKRNDYKTVKMSVSGLALCSMMINGTQKACWHFANRSFELLCLSMTKGTSQMGPGRKGKCGSVLRTKVRVVVLVRKVEMFEIYQNMHSKYFGKYF